jgi:tetratricopeptide (TPR) repeat protein
MVMELTPGIYDTIVGTVYRAVGEQFALRAVPRKEFDTLATALGDLAEAQARTERSLQELAQAQARSEERLTRVEAAIERLTEAQARTEQQIKELVAAQARTEQRFGRVEAAIERLAAAQLRLDNTVGGMRGRELERAYRDKASSYFGRMLRQVRVASIQDIEERLLPPPAPEAFDDLLELDLLVGGRPRQRPDAPEVWLAVEISATLDRGDVERAQRRAAILRAAGLLAVPTVAGESVAPGLEALAQAEHVLLVQDGRRQFWEEALAEVAPL